MKLFKNYLLCLCLLFPAWLYADDEAANSHNPLPFAQWVKELKLQAKNDGISPPLLERAFDGLEPNDRIIRLDRKQPEKTKTFTQYLKGAVSDARVSQGRRLLEEHGELLKMVSEDFGVQPQFIVALWGIETNYGGYTGSFSVIEALATLAYDGRRSEFFRKELLTALQIIDDGHIALADMEGSWAGAMGQCQFMPSSFMSYAVDYDGDGKKDIWNNLPDIFASIANYLKQSGWDGEQTWGEEVRIPGSIHQELFDGKQYKSLNEWQNFGVRNQSGGPLRSDESRGAITMPGKSHEPVYLIYSNYDVLLKWNRSRYFASAVGLLSDAIKQ